MAQDNKDAGFVLKSKDSIPYGVYTLKNGNSGKYLNVVAGGQTNGTNIHIWNNPESESCQFVIDVYDGDIYVLRSCASGLLVNVSAGGKTVGTNVQTWWDSGKSKSNQWTFSLRNEKDGYYNIQSVTAPGMYLNCGGKNNGTNVHLWDNPESLSSQWQLFCCFRMVKGVSIFGTRCTFENVKNEEKYVNVTAGKDSSGTNIQLYNDCLTQDSQFIVEKVSNDKNLYTLRFSKSQNKYVSVKDRAIKNKANVELSSNADSSATRWYFDAIDVNTQRVAIRNEKHNLFLFGNNDGVGDNVKNVQVYANPNRQESQWFIKTLDMQLQKIDWDLKSATIGNPIKKYISQQWMENKISSSMTQYFQGSKKVTPDLETWFEYGNGFNTNAGDVTVINNIESQLPTIDTSGQETSIKLTTEKVQSSQDWFDGTKQKTTKIFEWKVPVNVPGYKTAVCLASVQYCQLDVPYKMTFRSIQDGSSQVQQGTWHGVCVYDLETTHEFQNKSKM